MPFLADRVLDAGLDALAAEASRLDICSAEPATYAEATSILTLGHAAGLVLGRPAPRAPRGRAVAVPAIEGAAVALGGQPAAWALSDPVARRLLAAGPLDRPLPYMSAGEVFDLPAFEIGIAGA